MKNILKKLGAVLVVLSLAFAMVTGMTASADEVIYEGDTLTIGDKTFTIIEGEVYSFREVLENVTIGLDHTAMDEVYFDGYQWNVSHRQNFTDGPWGIKENWFARESTWENFNCICVSSTTAEQNSEIWNSHEMMIEWNSADETDKTVYWSLQPLWSCSSNTWINFVAPHTGKIVLFEEYGNKITACSNEAPFYSFQQEYNRPWKISVEKNDVQVWPMDDPAVVLDKNNRAIDFPLLGKTGVMPVTEGDVISIRIDVAGEFESKVPGGEYEGIKIAGSTTATFNPCVAYTEIESDVPEVEDDFDSVDDLDTTPDQNNNNNNEKGLGWILYVIIGAGVLVVAAIAVVVIIIVSKKKKAKALSAEETVEEPVEEAKDELPVEESNDDKSE